ncbi:MAG: hypothetical protein J5528_03770 [Firmicutes bacterium]|nr:hypothetical protein [Bacillota bacterium]
MGNKIYAASFCRNGILGGSLSVEDEGVRYRTGKVTVPAQFRNLLMRYEDIAEVVPDSLGILPTVSLKMRDGESYRFLVFGRKSFCEDVNSHK